MIDEKMLKYAQIRQGYTRRKFGVLSNEEKALANYEKFCVELIEEIEQLKDRTENYYEYDEFMKKEDLSEELQPYYTNNDCCSYIVKLRKEKTELQQQNQKYKEAIDKATKELMNIPINASYSEIEEYSRKAYRALKEVE